MILDFQNNGAVVLTTQEPGAFLNFRWESGDGSIYINVLPSADISAGVLWVNGLDISQEASIYGDPSINTEIFLSDTGDPSIASLFLYTRELGPFTANLSISKDTGQISEFLQSWNADNWGGASYILGKNEIACSAAPIGDYVESNTLVTGPSNLLTLAFDILLVGTSIPDLVIYENGSDVSTKYILSDGYSSFTHKTAPTTTSCFLRFIQIVENDSFETTFCSVTSDVLTYGISVLNRPYIVSSDSVNIAEASNVQVEGDISYLLLRTNPKFSGNIKLIIDSSNSLFLDTFKVSDILTNKLYRRQKVSANSVFSGDIRRIFSSMPLGEMYRLDAEDTLNIAIPKTDLFDQYNLNYSYGARLFVDELYEEDYAMLAPLWINNKLPDYFAIFRMPGVINEETYPVGGEAEDLTELAKKFLQQGELMKSWGIKEGSPLGTYLRNHIKELSQVISPMFLSLSDPDLKDPDPNTWYGIAIDKGIITGRSETTYFFDQKKSNFTDLNAFCSQGFERLNLLCPNLINMEYAFNDPDVSLYTMQRYFGLYLTENPLYKIAYYSSTPDGSINIISLDGKDSQDFFDSEIFDSEGNIWDSYSNRIFTLDDILSIKRITNSHQIDGSERTDINEWVNKPGDNIFSEKIQRRENLSPFISIGINNLLSQGEHLRIVDYTDFKIWEIIGIDTDLLGPGEAWTYATEYSEGSLDPVESLVSWDFSNWLGSYNYSGPHQFNCADPQLGDYIQSNTISFSTSDRKIYFNLYVEQYQDLPKFAVFEDSGIITYYTLSAGGNIFTHDASPNSSSFYVRFIADSFNTAFESYPYIQIMEEFFHYPAVYRTLFSTKGSKSDQNTAIWNAWNVFKDYENVPFSTLAKRSQSQSLVIEDWAWSHDIKFQRLTAQTVSNTADPSSGFNSAAGYGDISFYGVLIPGIDDFHRIQYDSSFGPINFELFGDRMSIDVDIFNPASYYFYSIDSSISDLFEDNMLYLSSDNWYRLVQKFNLNTSLSYSFSYIEDPVVTSNKIALITEQPIITINNYWNAYAVYPLTISLMGINPVKDFDFAIYDSLTSEPSLGIEMDFKSSYWYKREGDSSTFYFEVGADSSIAIKCSNSYDIISGSGSITIGDESSTYNVSSPLYPFKFNTFDSSAIIQSTSLTSITYGVSDGSSNFKSYKDGYSEELLGDYYKDYDPSVGLYGSDELKYGLTVPTVVKWVGIGNDCRNNPIRLLLDGSILDVSTNFIPTADSFSDEIFYPSFKYLSSGTRNWEDYVFFDINDSLMYDVDGNTVYSSFKEFMISNPYSDVFSKLLYSNNNVDGTKLRSSIAYYNNYKNTIDSIINGISLSFQIVESARNILDIQDWNKFRISAIAVPSRNRDNNKPIEVFINENTETILIVWYQGNDILNYSYRNSSIMPGKGVLDPSVSSLKSVQWRGFDHTSKYYSHVKTPFGVNNSSLSSNIFNIYGISGSYDGSIASPFNQINLNFGDDIFSIFNAYAKNDIIGSGFEFYDKSYDTFRQYVNYTYLKQTGTYGSLVANLAYSYMKNENLYQENTCNWNVLNSILASNRIEYYIFRGTTIFRSSSFSVNPIRISINPPRKYNGVTTYSGWYRPKFNNILEFSTNEDRKISDTVQKDFIFGNTNIKSYNNITQLWYNKVVENVTAYDISTANAIGLLNSWNPFKSQWDSDYYQLSSGVSKTYIDGYNSTKELPSYFASKLIKLPEALALDSWSNTTTKEEFGENRISLSYNLTRTVVNIFKDTDTFISNWSDLSQADNVIDGYIKNTILSYYNISKPKIRVEIWRKIYQGESSRISHSLDSSFEKWDGANVEGNLNYVNNEYVYVINVVPSPAFVYFVKFTLFEK
jgi:hypothetical protein